MQNVRGVQIEIALCQIQGVRCVQIEIAPLPKAGCTGYSDRDSTFAECTCVRGVQIEIVPLSNAGCTGYSDRDSTFAECRMYGMFRER